MSECGTRHVFPTIYPPGPKTLDINQRCLCGLVRYGFVEIDLQQRIADLERQVGTLTAERDEAVAHYQEVGQFWHEAEQERDANAALIAELRAALAPQKGCLPSSALAWLCCRCKAYSYEGLDEDECPSSFRHHPKCLLARTPAEALRKHERIMRVVEAAQDLIDQSVKPVASSVYMDGSYGPLTRATIKASVWVALRDALTVASDEQHGEGEG